MIYDSYVEGFVKTCEAYGIDPSFVMKFAEETAKQPVISDPSLAQPPGAADDKMQATPTPSVVAAAQNSGGRGAPNSGRSGEPTSGKQITDALMKPAAAPTPVKIPEGKPAVIQQPMQAPKQIPPKVEPSTGAVEGSNTTGGQNTMT